MEPVNNNQFEVIPTQKRKVPVPTTNVYLNPALDLLANEDPMCNTAMEIVPHKKKKRAKSCDVIAFENSALDLGISKAAVNEFLVKELDNVRKKFRYCSSEPSTSLYRSADDIQTDTGIFEQKIKTIEPKKYSQPNISQLSCNLTANAPEKSFESNTINLDVRTKGPVHAISTDVVPQDNISNSAIPSVLQADAIQVDDVFKSETTKMDDIVDQNLPIIPTESNVDETMLRNTLNISEVENITDSGVSFMEQKSLTTTNLENNDLSNINNTNIQTNITNQIFVNNTSNLSLSFLDRLALDSSNLSNQSLIFDDDLNESNIMEIKTITIITKKKRISDVKKNTNPFLDPELNKNFEEVTSTTAENPFSSVNETNSELEYNEENINGSVQLPIAPPNTFIPRRLFASDTNSTISTVNESIDQQDHEYENIDNYRADSPVYENVGELSDSQYNKQSKILGCDVSQFSAIDVMNLNKNCQFYTYNNTSNGSKKESKHNFFKTLKPKKMLKCLKKTFKNDKNQSNQTFERNVTLNPYEIPRKIPKDKLAPMETSGIENPALNLDGSDSEIEEVEDFDDDEEHQYETIKTLRNTRLNMNVTPLRERNFDNLDISHKTNTPGKKVRFDSTLNQEKIITGNSFDYDLQSPGVDSKIDKYHDELENCINERKYLQQNM